MSLEPNPHSLNSIEERDNKLTFALKESMEIRGQLTEADEKKEKKSWWQFWRKIL
ncbi:hypothetical protein [Lysinibacillus sp. NPDC059133]|uniref:hypothetical protein n=1 Tax=Lysinibacillus sp. NPDC059133 TaxID=3346737 RepID=UPI0036891E2F